MASWLLVSRETTVQRRETASFKDEAVADHHAIRVRFKGIVQGVGFRAHVQHCCRRAGIAGWVRNVDDGSVEAELIGAMDELAETMRRIREGRPHQISSVDVVEVALVGAPSSDFEIRL
jgi:acylphosphatase